MRRVKKEKRNKVLIFSVIILLLVCAGIAIASLHKVNNILLENSSEATIEIIGIQVQLNLHKSFEEL